MSALNFNLFIYEKHHFKHAKKPKINNKIKSENFEDLLTKVI